MENCGTHVFSLVAVASSLGDVFQSENPLEIEDMEEIMLEVGKNISHFLRLILGMAKRNFRERY